MMREEIPEGRASTLKTKRGKSNVGWERRLREAERS